MLVCFQTGKSKYSEMNSLWEMKYMFFFMGGAGGNGLITVLTIKWHNKTVPYWLEFSSKFPLDIAGQMKDTKKFFQASQTRRGTINHNQGLLCNTLVFRQLDNVRLIWAIHGDLQVWGWRKHATTLWCFWEMWPRRMVRVCMTNLTYFNQHVLNVLCTEIIEHFHFTRLLPTQPSTVTKYSLWVFSD